MDIMLIVITLLSLAVAGTMSVVAWRVVREERLRSEVRVAALAADIRADDADLPPSGGVTGPGGMFTSVQPSMALPRLAAVVVAGALVVGGGAALIVALGSRDDAVAGSASSGQRAAELELRSGAAAQATPALELVALGHDRDDDRLTVRGLVRNPANGSTMNQLTAVVIFFNREGGVLSNGRAPVQSPALGPGGETTFLVTVPGAAAVGRYRVSFRSEERVIPHVDIRR